MFAPPHSTVWLVPSHSVWQARSRATSEEEHAVSTAMLGPCRSKAWESRLAAMDEAAPDIVYGLMAHGLSIWRAP